MIFSDYNQEEYVCKLIHQEIENVERLVLYARSLGGDLSTEDAKVIIASSREVSVASGVLIMPDALVRLQFRLKRLNRHRNDLLSSLH